MLYIAVLAKTTGKNRKESLFGREFMVVPVVAIVEGVLRGLGASAPELALASEFGKVPQGWNGRPLVMNHPVINGAPVSANSPAVLQDSSFGSIFNAELSGKELRVEAWIDLERVSSIKGEVKSTIQRIRDGKNVEVSVGLFTETEQAKGKFNGKSYDGVWRNIVPDHLAFLSEGSKGACSNEDGCGVRANSEQDEPWSFRHLCNCTHEVAMNELTEEVIQAHQAERTRLENLTADLVRSMGAPPNMIDADIKKLIRGAFKSADVKGAYVLGVTKDTVIYEQFDAATGNFSTWQRSYTIKGDNEVSLGDDAQEVDLLTKVVPKQKTKANEGETPVPEQKKDAQAPAATPAAAADPTKKDEGKTPETPATPKTPEVRAEVTPQLQPTPPKVKTMAEFMADAPQELREQLEQGQRVLAARKTELVNEIKANERNDFSDDELKTFSIERLEKLAKLAKVPTFEGANPAPRSNTKVEPLGMPPNLVLVSNEEDKKGKDGQVAA